MAAICERVYLGHDEQFQLELSQLAPSGAATPIDLSPIVRMVMDLVDGRTSSVVTQIDTDAGGDQASAIDYSGGNGRIVFRLGRHLESIGIPTGRYYLRLVGVDGSGAETVLLHEASTTMRVEIAVDDGVVF